MIIEALKNVSELVTFGGVDLLNQIQNDALQVHQLPAAIVLPAARTAQPKPFIGTEFQAVAVSVEVVIITAIAEYSRHQITQTAPSAVASAIAAVQALSCWSFSAESLDPNPIADRQQAIRLQFTTTEELG